MNAVHPNQMSILFVLIFYLNFIQPFNIFIHNLFNFTLMSIQESLQIERNKKFGNIILFKESSWWRAYEESAFICHYFAKDLNENERLKPTRRKYKDIDESCIFVGFPVKSISKYLPNIEDRMIYNDDMNILTINVLDFVSNVNNFDDEYIKWKNSVAIKTKNKSNNDNNNVSNNLNKSSNEDRYFKIIELVQEIVSFPIEHKTMIENMLFISDIKQKFLKII